MVGAWVMGELSSRVGVMGIVKKAAYLLAVIAAIAADWIVQTAAGKIGVDFGGFYFLGLLGTIWLILNECISILENVSEIGVPLPRFSAAHCAKAEKGGGNRRRWPLCTTPPKKAGDKPQARRE